MDPSAKVEKVNVELHQKNFSTFSSSLSSQEKRRYEKKKNSFVEAQFRNQRLFLNNKKHKNGKQLNAKPSFHQGFLNIVVKLQRSAL